MRKEIYVSDADAEVLDQVKALASEESLSTIVVRALRDWVENRKTADEGLRVYEIQPGRWPQLGDKQPDVLGRPIKFRGCLLACMEVRDDDIDDLHLKFELYQTQGGKIIAVRYHWGASLFGDEEDKFDDFCAFDAVDVTVYPDLNAVPRDEGWNATYPFEWDGPIGVPIEVWEAAAAALGELDAEWIE